MTSFTEMDSVEHLNLSVFVPIMSTHVVYLSHRYIDFLLRFKKHVFDSTSRLFSDNDRRKVSHWHQNSHKDSCARFEADTACSMNAGALCTVRARARAGACRAEPHSPPYHCSQVLEIGAAPRAPGASAKRC